MLNGTWQYVVHVFSVNDVAVSSLEYIASNDWREEIMICTEKSQLGATQWFIELIIRSTCFKHYYANHQELETIQVVTACGT
jgi:hypothetical protein